MKMCGSCPHPRGAHDALGERCVINGCPCDGFVDIEAKALEPNPTAARRVCIDVPDGYMLSVSLVPYVTDAAPAEPADG